MKRSGRNLSLGASVPVWDIPPLQHVDTFTNLGALQTPLFTGGLCYLGSKSLAIGDWTQSPALLPCPEVCGMRLKAWTLYKHKSLSLHCPADRVCCHGWSFANLIWEKWFPNTVQTYSKLSLCDWVWEISHVFKGIYVPFLWKIHSGEIMLPEIWVTNIFPSLSPIFLTVLLVYHYYYH